MLALGDTGGVELGLEFFSATNTQEPTLTWYAVLPPGSFEFVTPDLSPPLERWRVPADASVRPRLTVVDADWLPWDTYRVGGPAPLPRGQRVRMTSFRSAGWW